MGLTQNSNTLHARIVAGSIVLLTGSGLTTAINLTYNIVLARFLGPKGFGQAAVIYTILTLVSAVTLSFQIISAKMVAKQNTPELRYAVYKGFHRGAWICGILAALVLLSFKGVISDYLNLPDHGLIALLAIGVAFYVPLGCRRGYIQGTYGFKHLATNLVVEGAFRLGGSLLLILMGYGVTGVIVANAAAVAVAYLAAMPKHEGRIASPIGISFAAREATQALIFFSGQVLINNCDIVLVIHFFSAKDAGLYAAVAMVGRVIFSFSSAVVNSMFPIVAGTRDEERKDLTVIAISLSLVLITGALLAFGLILAPARIWTSLFGPGFEIAGNYNLPYLMALYAVTTIIYSLCVVIITYEMSYKIANTSWVQLAFSVAVIACIYRYHSTLRAVVFVQMVLMTVLLAAVALPFFINLLANSKKLITVVSTRAIKLIRRTSENEVIAEFLKSDFDSPEFQDYREILSEIVSRPNLDDESENAKRRALLFMRHRSLWKEIPSGTEWFEVEIVDADLCQIRVFPRAHWRKLAKGNFTITEVAERMRIGEHLVDASFHSKIASIDNQLHLEDPGFNAVILIGLNEREPLTVLDGNHRLAAAVLSSPSKLKKLRFLCGLSPRMSECCWYNTNLATLIRYGRNRLARVLTKSEAELSNLLHDPG